ncbi:hypothetical protein DICSQDRAFT_136145 [Dichomitus squalens LYAD-421 SS1]|uniref:Uncharacterized protein n=1 Tax=Dichomitus squalens (strain LYAD-421) TaxID=732165 RepID=R7T0Z6_DICSQ|nr:uncharacterized protein DICSQDRAFT_136145 [Dichomitus squalens LYAD-421 SS1]EJF62026.1 hypothetical protein DICSQDRAFT_136145 [Dichomitus squalens LYAD-421 SS1]
MDCPDRALSLICGMRIGVVAFDVVVNDLRGSQGVHHGRRAVRVPPALVASLIRVRFTRTEDPSAPQTCNYTQHLGDYLPQRAVPLGACLGESVPTRVVQRRSKGKRDLRMRASGVISEVAPCRGEPSLSSMRCTFRNQYP